MSAGGPVRDVVLLHGWGTVPAIWGDLAARLVPHFRVHAPGWLAQGSPAERTLDLAVESLARSAPRRCHVVGWSLGGQAALAWARRMPRQVRRVALLATTPRFTRRPGWTCAVAPEALAQFARELRADPDGTLERFAARQARGDGRAQPVIAALKRWLPAHGTADARALDRGLSMLECADLRASLAAIAQPVLVLHGARDRVVPAAAGRRLAAGLPDARFVLLRGCAHAPFVSQPQRVARLLRKFFDE